MFSSICPGPQSPSKRSSYGIVAGLRWNLRRKDFILPVPGSRNSERIKENFGAAGIELTDSEYSYIEAELSKIEIHGNRTDEDIQKLRSLA